MTPGRHGGKGEGGFALVTAVIAMALLAALSLTLIQVSRGTTIAVAAEIEHAKLKAAADAGLVLALHHLTITDRDRRWALDGRPHAERYAGDDLRIVVEDERGKIPLNSIDDAQVRRMFGLLGVDGDRLDALTDAFLDWRDDDDDVRLHGAESGYYAPLGIQPRNGALHTIDELLDLRGMTPALLARLRPNVSLIGGVGVGFDERYAPPFAIRAMGENEVSALIREREVAGERPALSLTVAESLIGRAVTIRVTVRAPDGGAYRSATIVQLTGRREQPYLVRAID